MHLKKPGIGRMIACRWFPATRRSTGSGIELKTRGSAVQNLQPPKLLQQILSSNGPLGTEHSEPQGWVRESFSRECAHTG